MRISFISLLIHQFDTKCVIRILDKPHQPPSLIHFPEIRPMKHLIMLGVVFVILAGCNTTTKRTQPRLHVGLDRYHLPITTDSTEALV